jgi:heme/copper-type cytochrome/quinol oxidase subunit 3
MATDTAAVLEEMYPPIGEESLGVVHGKVGMWTFLVMDAMTFAGFLAGYARLRWGIGGNAEPFKLLNDAAAVPTWPYPSDTFGTVGIQLTAFNTFVLVCSSVTMVHALSESLKGNMDRAANWMIATILGGLFFLGVQGFEWTHLIKDVWPWLIDPNYKAAYNPNFAATFFCLTGFHGCHVAVGVIYNMIILLGIKSGKITKDNASLVELAGLYWHFVDLVWILVFTFVYLI